MRRLHANLLLLIAALIWGMTFSIQQMAMEHIGPVLFTGVRFLIGAAVVLPFALKELRAKRRDENWRLSPATLPWLALTGAVLFTAALLQQFGIAATTVANAGFLTALYVPLTPILAFFVLRQMPHPAIWPAAVACLGGAYLMAGGALDDIQDGDAWVIAGALFWATHILLIGAMTARTGAPFVISFVQFFVCGILGTVWATVWGGPAEAPSLEALSGAAPMLAFSGILSVGLGFTLQVVGQRHTPAADASVILSAETVFAALAGAVLLGEHLGALELGGGALILTGVLAVELLPLTFAKVRARR
ncbi:DMT family transporter [Magnetovibrio sp.]|uniref:DMT family transporter n=1 Tax=Magnetovibrio sp. TaxID=2024836 RepID=UPI002F95858F